MTHLKNNITSATKYVTQHLGFEDSQEGKLMRPNQWTL